MKKELSPGVIGVVIALVVIVVGVIFYRQIVVNPPSAHPEMHFSTTGAPKTPGSASTAQSQ